MPEYMCKKMYKKRRFTFTTHTYIHAYALVIVVKAQKFYIYGCGMVYGSYNV